MRRSTLLFAALMASIFVFYSCRNENADGQLTLLAEGMNHGGKMLVDGYSTMWASGDQVRINDETVTVSVSDGSATVSSDSKFTAPFFGVYPAGIYGSNSGASYTLNLPATYSYAVADGKQNLASPMVAYADSGSTLMFKHLTAAIGVEVVNYYGFTIAVDSIVVESDSYKLNGAVTVTLGDDIAVVAAAGSAAADRRVKMTFGDTPLQVFAGDSTVVQVPVLPVGSGNKFTVKICVHKVDQPAVAKAIEKTQSVGGALDRSYLAYARLATPGLFSVAANKKVIISQGNLQYQASTGTWKFATEQYTGIGNAPGNNVFDDTRATQIAWIDLFGWGTSGYNGSAYGISNYQPYSYAGNTPSSVYGYGYGPNTRSGNNYIYEYNLTGEYANCDWGVYNAIYNGGNESNRWRTLTGGTGGEWAYLMSTRTASTVNNVSNARYLKSKVNGVNGYIVFPDEFELPENVTVTSNHINYNVYLGWSSVTTSLTVSDWAKMEAAGAVFLPCIGYRSYSSNNPSYNSDNGYYWSTIYRTTSDAYNIQMGGGSPNFTAYSAKRLGCSVRLVRDIN